MILNSIEAVLAERFAPSTHRWTNPRKAAWYSWDLQHCGQGPLLSLRLVCPLIPAGNVVIEDAPFEICLVASRGRKAERTLVALARISQREELEVVIKKLFLVREVLDRAPRCPTCGAATYPEHVKSTSRIFWSCVRFPACKGMKRAAVTRKGKSPKTLEEIT